ncbi:MAG: 50S ribosomal protein L31 [Proteobacteria bacterium]|jgi:large subunit ribosomal protein L31|nr:50S ribosomal protein L31 [Pseudomonadota bacterium]
MKSDIHPKIKECKVMCACGNNFTTRAIFPELKIDICNVCHPFFTGKMKLLDTEGRVDKFMRKYGKK